MLDHLRVHAAPQKQRGAGVAEVVPAYVGQPGTAEQGLEVPVHDILSVHRCALRGREYEAVILPLCAGPKLFPYLALPLAPEGFYRLLGQVDGPLGSVLGFAEDEPAALPYPL